jgi:hypothetical protein
MVIKFGAFFLPDYGGRFPFPLYLSPERAIPVCDPVLYPCANNARVEQFIVGRCREGLCWE